MIIRRYELLNFTAAAALGGVAAIDMCMLRPPFLTLASRSAKFRVIGKPLDVIAPRFLLSCWVATAE